MSGTVGIVAGDTGRYTMFAVALTQLKHPPGTRVDWSLSTHLCQARNNIVKRALAEGSDWVFFMDDDHVYPNDILMRLLDHELPMVCALYLRRQHPFVPVAMAHRDEDGLYTAIDLSTLPKEGLLKIEATGAAGMLIRREVFEAISEEDDWFEFGATSEDYTFCQKVQEAGYDIFVDLEAQMGHLSPCAVWPSWVDQEWAVGFSVADGLRLYCPIEKAAAAADAVRR